MQTFASKLNSVSSFNPRVLVIYVSMFSLVQVVCFSRPLFRLTNMMNGRQFLLLIRSLVIRVFRQNHQK